MQRFFSKRIPAFSKLLLIESGNRQLAEALLAHLYEANPEMHVDILTCYTGAPAHFQHERGQVYNVNDFAGAPKRKELLRDLICNQYSVMGVICSAEPIMTRWKWFIAGRVPVKVFVVNENGDRFWLDRGHLGIIRHFVLFRAGLSDGGAVRTLGRLVLFPFTLAYLVLFAAAAHLRRKLRTI